MHQPVENIKFIRLITGEDIITEMKPIVEDNTYTLINPLKVVYALDDRPGVVTIGLIQWIFPEVVNTQEFPLKESRVLTMLDASHQMKNTYFKSLQKLEKSMAFEFLGDDETGGDYDYDEKQLSDEEFDVLEDLIESIKKRDKGSLH